MDRETALRKVLRCLRLAASPNAHESAAALRQARALMDQYGLTEADAYATEIHEADAATRCRGAVPPQSLMFLIGVVSDGFRCDVVVARSRGWRGDGSTAVRFYGGGSDPQVAAYAFAVLRRQLEADKTKHTRRIRQLRARECGHWRRRATQAGAFGMTRARPDTRARELAAIHVAAKQLSLDRETYEGRACR